MTLQSDQNLSHGNQAFLYHGVYLELRNQILEGKILPGERFPAERDLQNDYEVSRPTIRRALTILENEGLVQRRRGAGCYILPLSKYSDQNSVRMKMGIINSIDNSISRIQLRFANRVKELTRGRLTIELYPDGSLGTVPQQLRMVKRGELDLFSGDTTYLEIFDRRWAVSNLPFLYHDIDHLQKYSQSLANQNLRSYLINKHKVRIIGPTWVKPPHLLMADQPCFTLDDFRKLKILSIDTEVTKIFCKALGASWVPGVPIRCFDEFFEQGKVNAVQVARILADNDAFHKKLPYLLLTDHIYSQLTVVISQKKFAKLRLDLRDALFQASQEISKVHYQQCIDDWNRIRTNLLNEGCHIIRSDNERFRNRAKDVIDNYYRSEPELISTYRQIADMY